MAGPDNPAGGTAGPGGGHGPHGQDVTPGGTPTGPPAHAQGPPQVPLGAVGGEWIWNPMIVTDQGDTMVTEDEEVESDTAQEDIVRTETDSKKFTQAFSAMKNLNVNGVVFNKLLVWMDIQKDMIPCGTWKAHLKTLFTDEEVIDAKNALFEAVGGDDTRIGKFMNHLNNDKGRQKHLDDLIEAADKLWNNDEMPLLVASSKMVKGVRNYNMVDADTVNIADAINKMKQVEDTLKACLNENTAQVKNLADAVEWIKKAESDNSNGRVNISQVTSGASFNRVASIVNETNDGKTPSKRKIGPVPVPGIQPLESAAKESMYPALPATDQALSWSAVLTQNTQNRAHQQHQHQHPGAGQQAGEHRQTPRQKGAWKKSLNLLHGTADSNSTLAADVSLVAYGVAKDASADLLKTFLDNKGIKVIECEKLTTWDQARTHCYKVTIKASEFEKATKPEVWPYRVGVRLFKQFREKKEDVLPSWGAQQSGQNYRSQQPPHTAPPVRTPLMTSNRFSALAQLSDVLNH